MKHPAHTKATERFVAYYRVSTQKQGKSGLGLDAQREQVERFIQHNGNRIIAEFTEQESGGKDDRPQLIKAIEAAKEHDAVLVVAKLDRLSRNVSFISTLMNKDVKFICCDLPEANELTIHIFAAMAQHERKRIGERIKEALDAKRKREPKWKPGNPKNLTKAARKKAHQSISRQARESTEVRKAYHYIDSLRTQGLSWEKIAVQLNKEGYQSRTGKKFYAWSAWNIYQRFSTTQPKSSKP